jgi:fructose-1,6-bisphosphatase/inositol monophosphatase family enzyme
MIDCLEDLLQYVTVMLCVTVDKQPTIGIIYAPFTDRLSKLIK